ncbi:MAG: METTL5 family protein [Candidatus Woesearchaeota archaeon]
MWTKSKLAIQLSKLKGFEAPSEKLEQYITPSEIAAELIWEASMLGDIDDKKVADLGAGTGILGIGTLLLGAKSCLFLDKSETSLKVLSQNIKTIKSEYDIGKAEVVCCDISKAKGTFDVVIMNPPFGIKDSHADKSFLEKAFELAPVVYSFHKAETMQFLDAIGRDHGFEITRKWQFAFPIKAQFAHHTRKLHRIDVVAVRFSRI